MAIQEQLEELIWQLKNEGVAWATAIAEELESLRRDGRLGKSTASDVIDGMIGDLKAVKKEIRSMR